jgi:hypothetical protein
MNCFVIMPFSPEFDDVYAVIKASVEGALSTSGGRCFRLDEARPAGRITDRLLTELQATSLCVADLTGNSPNVMWEMGYAMALNKPMVIVTQNLQGLPFDIRDMQSLEYDRRHLSQTLGSPLRRMVIDTVSAIPSPGASRTPGRSPSDEIIAELRDEVSELKSIVAQAVRFWDPGESLPRPVEDESKGLMGLEGAWLDKQSGSHVYASVVDGDLIAPYCFNGDSRLTGIFYDWKLVGEYWFVRFKWLYNAVSGFSFMRQESRDLLTGAWWDNYDVMEINLSAPPPIKSGAQSTWERRTVTEYPEWAAQFIAEVRQEGLERRLMRERRVE